MRDGRKSACKECMNKQKKEWALNNPIRARDYAREYSQQHREEIKEYRELTKDHRNKRRRENGYNKETRAKWTLENKDKIKERNKKWYADNIESIRIKSKAYRQSDVGRVVCTAKTQKRRAILKSLDDGTVTKESLFLLKEKQDNKCYHCGCELDFKAKNKVHLDHLIPISKGGSNSISNVVWSCKSCNLRKGSTVVE